MSSGSSLKSLLPTISETVVIAIATVVVLVGFNFIALVNQITRDVPIDKVGFSRSVSNQFSGVSGNRIASIGAIVIFWALIGLGVYTVFWLALNLITGIKNEVVVETDYVNKARFIDRVKIPLLRIILGGVALALIALSLKYFMPIWIGLARQFLGNLNSVDLQTSLMMLSSLIGCWLNLYLVYLASKMVWQLRD